MATKIFKIISYVVLALCAAVILHYYIADLGELEKGLALTQDMASDVKVLEMDKLATDWGGLMLNFTIILLVVCAVLTVCFSLYQFIKGAIENPKKAIKSVIGLAGIAVVVFISYSLSSDEIPKLLGSDIEITNSGSKWIETSLYVLYAVFGVSLVTLFYGEISKVWK